MHNNNPISLSVLRDYDSLNTAIGDIFGLSKSQIKKSISSNKELKRPVKSKSSIKVPSSIVNYGMINPVYSEKKKPVIIYEDETFLCVSKPVKVHCHPLSYDESDNVLSFLRESNYTSLLDVNKDSYDRSLLYRLDYETSGLLILLKNESLLKNARDNFKDFVVKKKYLAIVSGKTPKNKSYTDEVVYKGAKAHKAIVTHDKSEKSVQLNCDLKTLDYNLEHDFSLVELTLKEGHRHQLRVQMMNASHPIIGDELYGQIKYKRMFLHCYEYELNIDGEKRSFRDKNLSLFSDFFNLNSHF